MRGIQTAPGAGKTFALTLTHNHNNLSFLWRKVSKHLTPAASAPPGVRAAAGRPASSAGRACPRPPVHPARQLRPAPAVRTPRRPAARHTSACSGRTRRARRTQWLQSGPSRSGPEPRGREGSERRHAAPSARTPGALPTPQPQPRARGHAAAPSGAAPRCAARTRTGTRTAGAHGGGRGGGGARRTGRG